MTTLVLATLLIHTFTTLFMVGLIWFVQIVHYPLFGAVGRGSFPIYEQHHTRLTSWVVGPPMLTEAATATILCLFPSGGLPLWMPWAGLILVSVNALSTAFLQMPCHHQLREGYNKGVHARLVRTNWIRTTAWSARGILAVAMFSSLLTTDF
ncbi:MAG: hypothetical protein KDA80_08650 [Planctomycetaceae bacterium]|nr:hypothetical protein [Planctomycetaceae bacterium]